MSELAAALILHPQVSRILKFLSTTTGRDKVRGLPCSCWHPGIHENELDV
jgi:hypothetical protein